jgi:hypothetical protein
MKYFILIALLIPYSVFAQIDMSVNKNSGGAEVLKIVNSNNITFSSTTEQDMMYVKKNDGTTDVYKLSDVNAIIFDGVIDGVSNITSQLFNVDIYPNPFQESTNISYTLDKYSYVEINIYNFKGKIIKSFLNGFQEPGNHLTTWEGTNSEGIKVSTGIYYYQLKIDNTVITKQAILIK